MVHGGVAETDNNSQNAMEKIVSFAVLISVLLFGLTASAQIPAVRSDYDKYARLFQAGKEPDFATDVSWRGAYARNNWKGYADGTEFREPLPEAQVLMGLYSLSTVERKLNNQIESIVLEKALLSKTLSETIVLDQIAELMEKEGRLRDNEGSPFVVDGELVGDYRSIRFDRIKMERLLRQRITGPVPEKIKAENRAVLNLFRSEIAGGWVAKYRVMREQISVLDTLANSFAFNWNKERRGAELNRLMEDVHVQKEAEARASSEIETLSRILIVEEVQEIKGRHLQEVAKEELEKTVAKHTTHKYIIGVYQGMDYHERDLEKIYHYFLDAANQGNPVAQYHVALFLVFFGDILDMKKDEVQQQCQDWLEKAYSSELARKRVVDLNAQLSRENEGNKIEKRKEETARKIEKLLSLEHERIDMVDNTLIQTAKRVSRINGVQQKMIEEMERERERIAITERETIRAVAIIEAARLNQITTIQHVKLPTPPQRWPTLPLR